MRALALVLAGLTCGLLAACGEAQKAPAVGQSITVDLAEPGVLASGASYLLALDREGRVIGWGGSGYGSKEVALSASKRPRQVLDGSGYRWVAAGTGALYAISRDGRLWRGALEHLGDRPLAPTPLLENRRWRMALESFGVGAGIDRNGGLLFWSDRDLAELARGSTFPSTIERAGPRQLAPELRFIDICLMGLQLYAISEDGRLWHSDDLATSSLRQGAPTQGDRKELHPVAADAGVGFARVFCGENRMHLLALDRKGRAWGMGMNTSGELGAIGERKSSGDYHRLTELTLLFDAGWASLATGRQFSLAIAGDGSLWSWGRNDGGTLGIGESRNQEQPVLIDRERQWVAVTATHGTALAVDADGRAWAWGTNAYGALGDGGVAGSLERPTEVLTDIRFGGPDAY